MPNLVEMYLFTIPTDHFLVVFQSFAFDFLRDFFFVFEPYERKKLEKTSPLKVHNRFTTKISCILLGRVSTKVVQRLTKFQFLEFLPFLFSFSLIRDHMEEKHFKLQDILSKSAYQICSKNHAYS